MRRLVIGILAHVDAGKTTLSEALLYCGGTLRKLGRVDHGDAFLDTFELERERGITIFSKQALLSLPDLELQLLDTPGHVDFSAETERTLQVLDAAILVISGSDGVQSHTRTLWKLLDRFSIPTFLFVNKMDLPGVDRAALSNGLRRLCENCVDFTRPDYFEEAALCAESAMEEYLETGSISDGTLTALIANRKLTPCWFGSALRLQGVEEFLNGLTRLAPCPDYPAEFGARVYKISRDGQGTRLTFLKVTGGELRVKTALSDEIGKVDQIRIYSGAKFRSVEATPAGTVCAVTGLSHTLPGDGLGIEPPGGAPVLQPVLTYQVILPEGCDPHGAFAKLRELEEEEPTLQVVWNEQLREIHLQLMGEVQLEVLERLAADRYGLHLSFGEGGIVYRETIADTVEGVGHFEPLRHYAEVHLLLEPGPRGSGIRLDSICPTDQLDGHWQRLILSHLEEREFPGVLTGSPLTDVKITLAAGKAHEKHTEGGDFRQATFRAVRQGLMQAQSLLLEPWYDFRLEIPTTQAGRALTDLRRMGGESAPPETEGEETILTGSAPVAGLRSYAAEVAVYTRGRGRLACTLKGYEPCRDAESVIAAAGYDPERDVDHPADSVFCTRGAGVVVKWNEVSEHMHLGSVLRPAAAEAPVRRSEPDSGGWDGELRAIFERTYGPIRRRDLLPTEQLRRQEAARETEKRVIQEQNTGPEYLLVDGYNVIYAWEELKVVARDNLDAARKNLMDILSNYQGFRGCRVILVFDAYRVPHGTGEISDYGNIRVVYTREAETADAYIERATYALGPKQRVRVVTSDGAEQLIILCHGALRVPASAFHEEVERAEGQIAEILRRNLRSGGGRSVKAAMEKAGEDAKK
jgi:small GTP-binding protein